MSIAIAKRGRAVRFLGKKEVFDAPVIGQLATAMGGIRVERASGSNEPLQAAAAALEAGELVAMAPQGTIPRGPAFFDPVLKGRWGAARLPPTERGSGHSDRHVGHREGLAAVESSAQRAERHGSADGADPRRTARRRHEGQVVEGRHRADHEGDRQAAPARSPSAPSTRPPRSWRRPTRPAITATPKPRPLAAPAPTSAPNLGNFRVITLLGKIRVRV